MRGALTTALEKVDFTSKIFSDAELGSKGYDAQISLTQTNASSTIRIDTGYFTGIANAEMIIEAILVVSFPDGTRHQQSIKARGMAQNRTFTCNDVDPAIGNSGAAAIKALVERIAITIKLLLAQKLSI